MNKTYKGGEKRRYRRVRAEFIVNYKLNEPLELHMWIGQEEIAAVMLDLSELGMAILTKHDIPVDTTLLIKFTMINSRAEEANRIRTMEMAGKVTYNIQEEREHRLGICFTQLDKEDKESIANFVKMVK